MTLRSTSSLVRFFNPFTLPGASGPLPAGLYEVLGEETLITGAGFQTYRRRTTYLLVRGHDRRAGRGDMHLIFETDLADLLARDRALSAGLQDGKPPPAASPLCSGALSTL